MAHILAEVLSLIHYKNNVECRLNEDLRPRQCEHCKKSMPWRHGNYPRKSAGRKNDSDILLNPILIQRYYCSSCQKTMSSLPECIPPKRWYLWSVQQSIILLICNGFSIHQIAKMTHPSRHTISRWMLRFKESFLSHRDALICFEKILCQYSLFNFFWPACFKLMNLGKAMRLCHTAGVLVP